METSIENLTQTLSSLTVKEYDIASVIKIQKWYRGSIYRLKRLPIIMYSIKRYLKTREIRFPNENQDGRINSSIAESKIINLLVEEFKDRIKIPKPRFWYDILVKDYRYGWIPVNIKITTMKNADNTANLAMCVYAYTDEMLDIHGNKTYNSDNMCPILCDKIFNKRYNTYNKKDYYFLVLNKEQKNDIIINSVKGLTEIRQNGSNLPFQVYWKNNRKYKYEKIKEKIKIFVKCIRKIKPNWQTMLITFMQGIQIQSL